MTALLTTLMKRGNTVSIDQGRIIIDAPDSPQFLPPILLKKNGLIPIG